MRHVFDRLAAGEGGWVVTPNLDHLRRLVRIREFQRLCSGADLRVADGMPLVWASWLKGTPLPGRVAGSSLISTLAAAAATHRRSIYLLGGSPGTAAAAAAVLKRRHPELAIAGVSCPPPGFEDDPARVDALRGSLVAAAPDLVFVGLGSPKQEWLIHELRRELPRTWWLGLGISFSFLSGAVRRAPGWMQRSGLEWLHRLAQEPRRLARRYLVHGVPFAMYLLTVSAWQGMRARP